MQCKIIVVTLNQHHKYILNLFETTLDWKEICSILRKVTVHTFTKMFQYEIINNVTYLNKILFFLKKTLLDDYILFLNQKMKHQFTFSLTV